MTNPGPKITNPHGTAEDNPATVVEDGVVLLEGETVADANCRVAILEQINVDGAGSIEKSVEAWKKAALDGSTWAMAQLAFLLRGRHGATRDQAARAEWLKKASAAGRPPHRERVAASLRQLQQKALAQSGKSLKRLRAKVLVVDGEPDSLRLAAAALEPSGATIISVDTGEHGIAELSRNPDIRLLVLSMEMRPMSMVQFLSLLKAHGVSLPIVVISDSVQENIIRQAQKLNLVGYVVRPFQAKTLEDAAEKVLAKLRSGGARVQNG